MHERSSAPEPGSAEDPQAVGFGRRGGPKGDPARAEKLTADERSDVVRKAAEARWAAPADSPVAQPSAVIASTSASLRDALGGQCFGTVFADPLSRLINRGG
ncbi:MAG: hypothetical protein OEY20_17465 [Gemmatimonadota bacterium]|nr:hypothetical protein [Gemmatimonadota bacterium]